jgi:hypothetical protein
MAPRWILALSLIACPVWAGPFKCLHPDGSLSYQESPCPTESEGGELEVDTRPPGGTRPRGKGQDTTIQGQLRALESERKRDEKARERRAPTSPKAASGPKPRKNKAKCAKHRAEVARWRRAVRNGYRDKDDREREEQMLEHHRALVEQYCEG